MSLQLIAERRLENVVERTFTLGDVPGLLWLPPSASPAAPVPLVLAGQPGGLALAQTYPRLLARAEHAAAAGLASVTLELPGAGDRPSPIGVAEARAELQGAVRAGRTVGDDVVDRLVLPLVEQAVPEWGAALDELLGQREIDERAGVSGGVVAIGIRLTAIDPRISAAVLFAGSFVPRSILSEARDVTVPTHVLLQWDDEHNDRDVALRLFDALGSREKTLHANLGGHAGVPTHAGDEALRFLARHLLSA